MATKEMNTLLTIIQHRENLADSLEKLADDLRARGRVHDRNKLTTVQFRGFMDINSGQSTIAGDVAFDEHSSQSSHHPEFYGYVHDMPFLDIIEMVFDWKAAGDTYKNSDASLRQWAESSCYSKGFTLEQQWLIMQVVGWVERNL